MPEAIRHGLRNLFNGNGRDARQAFWYYVLFVFIVTTIVTIGVAVPMMIGGFFEAVRRGIAVGEGGDPAAAEIAIQQGVTAAVTDTMNVITWLSMATGVISIALLAMSFVRRLHDSDLSGYWALIPGAMQLAYLALIPSLMSSAMERMVADMQQGPSGNPMAGVQAMQASMNGISLLGWVSMIVIVVLGVRKSTPGPNRYGEAPFIA